VDGKDKMFYVIVIVLIWVCDIEGLSNIISESCTWTKHEMKGEIPRAGHTLTSYASDKVLLMGGGDGQHYLNDLRVLDTSTFEWTIPKLQSSVNVYLSGDLLVNQEVLEKKQVVPLNSVEEKKSLKEENEDILLGKWLLK
jgi:hypothetical protein